MIENQILVQWPASIIFPYLFDSSEREAKFKLPNSWGKVPVNWLLVRSRVVSAATPPSSSRVWDWLYFFNILKHILLPVGMVPVIWLVPSLRDLSVVTLPSSVNEQVWDWLNFFQILSSNLYDILLPVGMVPGIWMFSRLRELSIVGMANCVKEKV